MANNPLVNLLCGILSCIKGSLRVILFIGCLIFVGLQIGSVLNHFSDSSQTNFIRANLLGQKIGLTDHLLAFFLLFVAILGMYGSFYKHHKCLKLFAILTAIITIILAIGLAMGLMNDDLEKEHEKFIGRMKNYSRNYDWTEGPLHGDKNMEATKSWDLLQTLMCCGIEGPKDWDKLRPSDASPDEYPTSCCRQTGKFELCHRVEIFPNGCLNRIVAIEAVVIMVAVFYCTFMFLLSAIAYVLLLPEASDAVSTSSHRGVLPQDYQRFEGSVYVRQPSVAPQYAQPIPKDPPIYPNAHNVEKKGASSPPPSYY